MTTARDPVFRHLDDPAVPWQEVKRQRNADGTTASVWEKWFTFRADPGYLSLYGRYDPGMIVRRHGHRSPHVVFVLEGSIWCGDRLCPSGTHIELPEGAAFGPFRAGPNGVTMFEVMMGDPRSWGDRPELVEALRAEHGVTELPDPAIDLPAWLVDERDRVGRRWLTFAEPNPAIPAATVVLVRDGETGLEVLMLHRVSKVAFGGMWVFPGGRVDAEDRRPGEDDQADARRAAAREALEECGQVVDPEHLVPFSHWVPPAITPRRFATWFFVARAGDEEVVVDGGEIHEHEWLPAREVLDRRDRGEVDLAPPTWVTLHDLALHVDVEAALRDAAQRDPLPHYETRWAQVPGGAVAMWLGDGGYEAADPEPPGARHRLWMLESGWRLERD